MTNDAMMTKPDVGAERFGRVVVVYGGASAEREVSLISGSAILASLKRSGVDAIGYDLAESGLPGLQALAPDRVFIALHGGVGEDGTLQGALSLLEIPFTGSGVLASALGMDKDLSKSLVARTGIPVAPYQLVTYEAWQQDAEGLTRAISELRYPLFAKPANGGSSVGISRAATREDIAGAVAEALRFDRKVLVEQGIDGREIECAVLGNFDPQASPLGEISYTREFYDYEAKYEDRTTQLIAPVELPAEQTAQFQAMAVAAFLFHGEDPFAKQELAILYGACALAVMLLGPGAWSLDARR